MIGTLIDCWRNQDNIILWVKANGKDLRLEDTFIPKIYVKIKNPKEFQNILWKNKIPSRIVKKKTFFRKEVYVIEIEIPDLRRYNSITKEVERLAKYDLEIFNADMKLEEYYFFEKDLFPLARIDFEEKDNKITKIEAIDNAESTEYGIPDFSKCFIKVQTRDNLLKTYNTEILKIAFDKEILTGNEYEMLLRFKERFEAANPDCVFIDNGNLTIPFLKEKFNHYKIPFNFNRFEEDNFQKKEGSVIRSYAATVFRNESVYLKGRLHFDEHSFFTDDIRYYGIIDGARACRMRIQRAEMRSSGACVTNLLLYRAHKANFLLPFKAGLYERFKTLEQLHNADRGSIIFEPRTGFHKDVVEFDFVSLYPNIMNKRNLSPETLFCECCKDNKVPGLHYHYCRNERGIVSDVAKFLISRRIEYKKEGTEISKQKAAFLKWCLVTMFGYQAYKNRKIGIIETHEAIQAYAREIILKTTDIAELHGWEVIHGIIDSVYVRKDDLEEIDIHRLGKEIYWKTGMELNYEGRYKWIVFLPSIVDGKKPVPGRFYGVFEDGEVKCRGIELRKKDSPQIVVNMQTEMIDVLKAAKDEEEFRALFPKIFRILRNYIHFLPNAKAEDLYISKSLSKTDYKNEVSQKIIMEQMKEEGYNIQPGMSIAYIIKDSSNLNPSKRYVSLLNFNGKFDIRKYCDMMIRATYSIIQPFGISLEAIKEIAGQSRQTALSQFIEKEIEIISLAGEE